jgi:2-C-methyl-D-erythritol 2,4-cyclodiphosphate synthase/2-C-methyl-D-erythritol 4-phosphate cytidylyltransferase
MFESSTQAKCHVLIPSGGIGTRFGGDIPKQYQMLVGKKVIEHCISIFTSVNEISTIWIACNPQDPYLTVDPREKIQITPTGGQTRSQTVLNTLQTMIEQQIPVTDWVLVHDAARPGISKDDVNTLIRVVTQDSSCIGGILALPIADTVKESDIHRSIIKKTLNRDVLWQAQTPQMFRIGQLKDALEKVLQEGIEITDEASAVEVFGNAPLLIKGATQNFKITYHEDLLLMEKLLTQETSIRIGQGYDVHRLVAGRQLILGGIKIPHHLGLLGHSDADALLHAITDALLGAAALGDIGQHYSDSDPQYHNADSAVLLQKTYELVNAKGFTLVNIDATIICQSPKLASQIPSMIGRIAEILHIDASQINIKAKTNEGLGYLGNSEAIEAQAVVLIQTNNKA